MLERSLNSSPVQLRQIEENLKVIRERSAEAAIRSGRDPSDVRLMAVTKTVDADRINHAIGCGIDLIGENRVQEFLGKRDALRLDSCEAHLIGHLQTNKVRQIVGQVSMIQSVDSVRLAQEIGAQSERLGIVTDILLEVNIGEEASKSGFEAEQIPDSAAEIAQIPGIRVKGLMSIPPFLEDSTKIRGFFSDIYKLFIDMKTKKGDNIFMDILSMGMSGDYYEAILEGATLIRVGSALFGNRIYK